MLIVEVGFKLDKTLEYYDKILKMHGLENDFNCETHDIYYTKDNLNELTENEMKQKCIRLRNVNFKEGYKVENKLLDSLNIDFVNENELLDFENKLKENGYLKVFDTKKKDHHYYKEGMNTKVQLQEIDDIGLLVYLDNSNYYELPLEEQRNKLIDELNSYGFDFKYTDLGLDKLRTLYYQEKNIVKIKMVKAELHKCSFFFGNKVFYSTYFLTISTWRCRSCWKRSFFIGTNAYFFDLYESKYEKYFGEKYREFLFPKDCFNTF